MNTTESPCKQFGKFMRMQLEVLRRHISEHQFLRHIEDKNAAVDSFVHDYAWMLREIHCVYICEEKDTCPKAIKLRTDGDLLRDRHKEN